MDYKPKFLTWNDFAVMVVYVAAMGVVSYIALILCNVFIRFIMSH